MTDYKITKASDTTLPLALTREYDALTEAVNKDGIIRFAELYGFTGMPPSPGSAAAWEIEDWLDFGKRNNMTDVRTVAHGTKITHNTVHEVCVAISGSPGDVRSGMNCAADFRRTFTLSFNSLWAVFRTFAELITNHGLRINGLVYGCGALAEALTSAAFRDSDLVALGFPSVARSIGSLSIEVSGPKAYAAMTYLARVSEPPLSYPEVLVRVCVAQGIAGSRDKMGMLAKWIGHAARTKQPLEIPAALKPVVDLLMLDAAEHKEAADLERMLKREARKSEEAEAKRPDAAAAVQRASDKVREQFVDCVTRFGHDIAQLNERFNKAKAAAAAVDFAPIVDGLAAQAKRVDELEARCAVLDETVANQVYAMQEIAKLLDIDPASADLGTQVRDQVSAYRDAADTSDRVRKCLVDFATRVHDKLSTKDFLSIAAAITELLPEAEKLAITGGEED